MNLELPKNYYDRDQMHMYFTKILNLSSVRGSFFSDDPEKAKARKELIYNVAKQLLGESWSYEELC
jgi:hypothetical protein